MRSVPIVLACLVVACSGGAHATDDNAGSSDDQGEVVTPPFAVSGSAEGLLLTWYDEAGAHVAQSRSEVPAERRAEVRVDSLEIAPDDRDPDHVFVADLRTADEHGVYTVRRLPRESFEAHVTAYAAAAATPVTTSGGEDVVIYGAEWCHACREAGAYLRARGIPFVERDIERDAAAREEMTRRATEAGIPTGSIPIIDFRGHMLRGFDPQALDRAIRETSPDHAGDITI